MRCDRLREVLFDHLDGLLGAEEAEGARSHLAACADCRRLQEEVRRNFAAMDTWEDEELPAGAWERLRARVGTGSAPAAAAPPPRRWVRHTLPFAAGLATAAAALLVFVVPRFAAAPAGPLPGGGPAPVAPAPASPVVAVENPRPALRRGESPLRFDLPDFRNGVVRTIRLPGDVDPGKVMLVDATTRPVVFPDEVK